jgi:hypothetical protein
MLKQRNCAAVPSDATLGVLWPKLLALPIGFPTRVSGGSPEPPRRLRSIAPTACKQRGRYAAFTLAELLVTVVVLVLLVFLFTQVFKGAATVTIQGHKRMDLDSQARQVLNRMAIDFAQMVKRSDVDYYLKSSWFASGAPPAPTGVTGVRTLLQPGNDIIAFYSAVAGYYPSTGSQSPVSLVAYRINAKNKLERMGKGLVWNAVSTTDTPVVFMPIALASPIPLAELPYPAPTPLPTPAWQQIAGSSSWSDSELIGPQVFRFEYYYLLKGQTAPAGAPAPTPTPYSPIFSDAPWDTRICACPTASPVATPTPTGTPIASPTPETLCCHYAPEGMQDVAAVVVDIAVIDPQSKVLVTDAQINTLASSLIDWGNTGCTGCPTQTQWQTTPGLLPAQWRAAVEANAIGLPQPAISGIRVYERVFYLSPPTLFTP